MQSDITPRPRTDFSAGPAVHRGDYGLTPAAIAANQPAAASLQIPIVDSSAPVESTSVVPPIPSAPSMPITEASVAPDSLSIVPTPSSAPSIPAAESIATIPESVAVASVVTPEQIIASSVADLEVTPIVTPEPVTAPLQNSASLSVNTAMDQGLDSDFANLDMGQGTSSFVTSAPAVAQTFAAASMPTPTQGTENLDSLLQAVNGAPATAPLTEVKQPSAMKLWLSEHRTPVRATVATVALFFVGFSGLGIYHGYTHDTPYVSIAAPKPVAPAAAKTTAKLASASFADNSDDDKRQKTIKSLHEAVEAYYVQKGYYPTNTQMQSLAWIAANLKTIDMTQLKDPAGTTAGLVAASGKGLYAYQASTNQTLNACDNDFANCNYYVLTATLSDGSAYTSIAIQ